MFKITKREQTKLEKEIDSVLEALSVFDKSSDEYELLLDRLTSLYSIKEKDKKWNVSPDTMAVVAGNLIGIMLILKHEELNVITSKAMNFVIKGRA